MGHRKYISQSTKNQEIEFSNKLYFKLKTLFFRWHWLAVKYSIQCYILSWACYVALRTMCNLCKAPTDIFLSPASVSTVKENGKGCHLFKNQKDLETYHLSLVEVVKRITSYLSRISWEEYWVSVENKIRKCNWGYNCKRFRLWFASSKREDCEHL